MMAEQISRLLCLQPLDGEGGFYRETWRLIGSGRESQATALSYPLTSETFSKLHRLPDTELSHVYRGDPVELLSPQADGSVGRPALGPDIATGMAVQFCVPGGA